jgi:hypothetical protein
MHAVFPVCPGSLSMCSHANLLVPSHSLRGSATPALSGLNIRWKPLWQNGRPPASRGSATFIQALQSDGLVKNILMGSRLWQLYVCISPRRLTGRQISIHQNQARNPSSRLIRQAFILRIEVNVHELRSEASLNLTITTPSIYLSIFTSSTIYEVRRA